MKWFDNIKKYWKRNDQSKPDHARSTSLNGAVALNDHDWAEVSESIKVKMNSRLYPLSNNEYRIIKLYVALRACGVLDQSERSLAQQIGMAKSTFSGAVASLVRRGYLQRVNGRIAVLRNEDGDKI